MIIFVDSSAEIVGSSDDCNILHDRESSQIYSYIHIDSVHCVCHITIHDDGTKMDE